jgi:hypothetical protein
MTNCVVPEVAGVGDGRGRRQGHGVRRRDACHGRDAAGGDDEVVARVEEAVDERVERAQGEW